MRADQGLTLIELLIVIVILGILSAIIVFSVEGITNRGEAASCEASAQTVRIGAQAFYAQGQGPDQAARYPNDLQELADSDFVDTLPGTLSNGNLTLTFATGTFFVYNPTTGSVDSTGCGTVGNGGGGGGGGGSPVTAQVPGGTVSGGESVTLSATISGTAPTQVQFLVDGSPVGTDNSGPPWSVNWTATPGNHTVVARATINGSPVDSAGVALNVDAPAVAPTGGSVSLGGFGQNLTDGESITATTSGWTGTVTGYTYQWQRRSGINGFCFGGYSNFGNVSPSSGTTTQTTNITQTQNTNSDYCYRVVVTAYNGALSNSATSAEEYAD
ncbi:MAG: Ig-like domain-containing protein [Dehalococcoidia bacterium]